MEIILVITGFALGFIAAFLIAKYKFKSEKGVSQIEVDELNKQISTLQTEKGKAEERSKVLQENIDNQSKELNNERNKNEIFNSEVSKLKAEKTSLDEKLENQRKEVEDLQIKFTKEFENLANKILDEKSKKFTDQNKENITNILDPLKEKIRNFEDTVNKVYIEETKQRTSITKEIQELAKLNLQMTTDANNLTKALRGETKTQGNWGEFILESVLEKSGLIKDRDYTVQESVTNEDGKRFRPDVLVNLPDNKHIIIDSKVSLTAYDSYCSTDDESQRKIFLNEHIASIRKHVKELSDKNYQNLKERSPDFVIMFVPIEPALAIASQSDISIWNEAFEKNIVIISPSVLLATLRTIANIWKLENQNKNAFEIAKQAGALYDKFNGFLDDLKNIGDKIDSAQKSYNEAYKKLFEGKGNIISRIQNLKKMGATANKSIPQNLLDSADDDLDS